MKIVITDLDGTLLDAETHSYESSLGALEKLRRAGIPVVFCTSKTRAEVEVLRKELDNRDPFIVENGAALYVPAGYFDGILPAFGDRDGYAVLELGTWHADLLPVLWRASAESRCQVRGFHQMTVQEVAGRCGLSLEQAELAKRREYDEPFLVFDPGRIGSLLHAIEMQGQHWTRGNDFYHLTGTADKGTAVRALLGLYHRQFGAVESIGLGDSLNDIGFLRAVDSPVLVRSRFAVALKKAVRNAIVRESFGLTFDPRARILG